MSSKQTGHLVTYSKNIEASFCRSGFWSLVRILQFVVTEPLVYRVRRISGVGDQVVFSAAVW